MKVKTIIEYKDLILNKKVKNGENLIKVYEKNDIELTNERIDALLEGNQSSKNKPVVEVKIDDMDEVCGAGGGGTTYAPIRISFQDYMFQSNDGTAYDMRNEVQNIDTSKVKNLFYSFSNIQGVEKLDLSSWNTAKCEDFSYMFANSSFKYIDASNFTFEEAGTLVYMFESCSYLETLVLGAGWLEIYDWQLQEDTGSGLPGDSAEVPLLDNTNIQNIYVPDDLVEDFKGSYAFNMYADYIKPKSEM